MLSLFNDCLQKKCHIVCIIKIYNKISLDISSIGTYFSETISYIFIQVVTNLRQTFSLKRTRKRRHISAIGQKNAKASGESSPTKIPTWRTWRPLFFIVRTYSISNNM